MCECHELSSHLDNFHPGPSIHTHCVYVNGCFGALVNSLPPSVPPNTTQPTHRCAPCHVTSRPAGHGGAEAGVPAGKMDGEVTTAIMQVIVSGTFIRMGRRDE